MYTQTAHPQPMPPNLIYPQTIFIKCPLAWPFCQPPQNMATLVKSNPVTVSIFDTGWHHSALSSIKSGANGHKVWIWMSPDRFPDHCHRPFPEPSPLPHFGLCTSRVAGLKLFTKFNKIYHRLGTRAHAGNFIVVNSLEHSKRVPMKRHSEEDTLLNVCNSCHLDRVLDHLDGVHTNHEEILPQ